MRTQYVKAKNLIEAETRSGAGGDKVLRVWKHYDACMFLKDHVEVAAQTDSIPTNRPTSDETDLSVEVGNIAPDLIIFPY